MDIWEKGRAYFFMLGELMNEWRIDLEARGVIYAILSFSGGEGVAEVTNRELAEYLNMSVRTMARWRKVGFDALKKSDVNFIWYESGGWGDDTFRPTRYYIDWSIVDERVKKMLSAKRGSEK